MSDMSGIEELASKLDTLIRLQATALVDGIKTQKDRILFLSKAGLSPKSIGEVLGISANSVSVTLSKSKKEAKADAEG